MVCGLRIERLEIRGVRNIRKGEIELAGNSAFFFGGNGAGKTSIVEAVYLLARGKSFRSKRSGDWMAWGVEEAYVAAELCDVDRVYAGKSSWRRLGQRTEREATGDLRVRVVVDGAAGLLEGEPALRRGFLDLNLFHVEPSAATVLSRFRRALGQRNAWLRSGAAGRRVWDDEFISAALDLDSLRLSVLGELTGEIGAVNQKPALVGSVRIEYSRGWAVGMSLEDALRNDGAGERAAGFTRVGPQRADFLVVNRAGKSGWSRGQGKIIVALLQLGFERLQLRRLGAGSIWLLDDLCAELDEEGVELVRSWVCELGAQCLVTGVSEQVAEVWSSRAAGTRAFHVEQGTVSALHSPVTAPS